MDTETVAEVLLFTLPLVISAVTVAAMHWFPGSKQLSGINAYALHIGATVGVPIMTFLVADLLEMPHDWVYTAVFLMANTMACGITEGFCSWFDKKQPLGLEDTTK
jgi:hypothetical protein